MGVEGPAWTGHGVHESRGRYPLRVETAVSRIVERVLPGVITTTRHARMYSLHGYAWSQAEKRKLVGDEAEEFVRRCEVVVAAVHKLHESHRVELSSAHGEESLHRFLDETQLDVTAAARPGGLSAGGFVDVYGGPCIRTGILAGGASARLRAGPRINLTVLEAGLGGLAELATRDTVSVAELQAHGHLCLCEAADSPDGRWLRETLFEHADPDRPDDRYRQATALLLLDTLRDTPSHHPAQAFRERRAFGPDIADPATEEIAMVAALWRAAALRNYSVGAWRWLWWWLTAQLVAEPMTAEQLGERLAVALDDVSVAEVVAGLPPRTDGDTLLPVEAGIEAERPWTPMTALRQLMLGAGRLDDLDGAALEAFVGMDPSDLGPRWIDGLLDEWYDRHIRELGRELADVLIRRAKRVALSKMYLLPDGRAYVPTRLGDRDGLLTIEGEEGADDVALRIETLTQVLLGLGLLQRLDDGRIATSPDGEALRERIH